MLKWAMRTWRYWLLPPLLAFGFFITLVVLRDSGAITGIITSDLGH